MDPLTLLLLGGTALSGFLGGGKDTSTTTSSTQLSPELQAAFDEILKRVQGAFPTAYPTGAQPTAAYGQLTNMLPQITAGIGANADKYSGALDSIINRSPARIQIPTMVRGGPTATLSGASFGDGFKTNPGSGVDLSSILAGMGSGNGGGNRNGISARDGGWLPSNASFNPTQLARNAMDAGPDSAAMAALNGVMGPQMTLYRPAPSSSAGGRS